jgi:transposase
MLEEQAREKLAPPPAGINLSVDEVSCRKYHRYLTNVIDVDKRLVIWNDKGRKAEVLDRYYAGIGEEGCQRIESVALDGAKHYIRSTNRYAVNAGIGYDKFHLMQKLNGAVDQVRKEELRRARADENNELIPIYRDCRQRFILFQNQNQLSEKQANYLQRRGEINQPLYQAMLLKESFLQIYSYRDIEEVKAYLTDWIEEAVSSSLEVFKILAQSFSQKMQYIINRFKKKSVRLSPKGLTIKSEGLNGWPIVIRTSSIAG